ncbi:MAG: RES family NAD+ phosphorylase [Acidobacteria bacterium]|nr:RES family NAD+ phosphorylase [Acidobacteriota bacterium]
MSRQPSERHDFGTTRRARFDAARGEFGVLYAAGQIAGAFVETLARGGVRTVSQERLQRYLVAEITASRALSLVDLTGRGLVRMGVDGRLTTGAYQTAQRWSSAFFAHRSRPDGILYGSRHDPGQQLAAFFDRAAPCLTAIPQGPLRSHLGDDAFFRLLDHYDIGLL